MATPNSGNRKLSSETFGPSRWRRNRSNVNLSDEVTQPTLKTRATASDAPEPKVERAPSKMSLFSLFSRPRVEKARGHIEIGLAVPMPPPEKQTQSAPVTAPASVPTAAPTPLLQVDAAPASQQPHRSRSSHMLRPLSFMPSNAPKDGSWDLPPLFQAFPQSIKHGTLQSCVFSADDVLKTQSQRKQYERMRDRIDSHRDLPAALDDTAEGKKLEKVHKRLVSNSIVNPSTPELTDKVYVLVTEGYVLQYTGDGSFDRLPEKALKLGKDSAAFACDAIPGKHWVLQISQTASEDGTVAAGPKTSLLSRLRAPNSFARKAAASFLLVLDSAAEMDSWMTAVRKEIDNRGGMKVKEDIIRSSGSTDASSEAQSVDSAQLSHRYLLKRDKGHMDGSLKIEPAPQSHNHESSGAVVPDMHDIPEERTASVSTASIGSATSGHKRKSMEVPPESPPARPFHQSQRDASRERSRFSITSLDTSASAPGTANTSHTSSPTATSPVHSGFSSPDSEPLRSATSLRSFHMIPGSAAASRRISMHPLPVTDEDSALCAEAITITPLRHSIYGPASPTLPREPIPMSSASPDKELTTNRNETPTSASTSQLAPLLCQPSRNVGNSARPNFRSMVRSSSAPPARHGTLSPPPQDRASSRPGRPQSTIGTATLLSTPNNRRLSRAPSPKPFLKPIPVRPQAQHTDGSVMVVPRRLSSLGPPPSVATGVIASAPTPSALNTSPTEAPRSTTPSQSLRRPNSMQIRSNPAPFLSSSRPFAGPIRAVQSTPSFLPSRRISAVPQYQVAAHHPHVSVSAAKEGPLVAVVDLGTSAPAASMSLPPPGPPPSMPLPPPPSNMPLPSLPPNVPLPSLPSAAHHSVAATHAVSAA